MEVGCGTLERKAPVAYNNDPIGNSYHFADLFFDDQNRDSRKVKKLCAVKGAQFLHRTGLEKELSSQTVIGTNLAAW